MKRNINFKNVLCMAAITLVTGMLGGCEDKRKTMKHTESPSRTNDLLYRDGCIGACK